MNLDGFKPWPVSGFGGLVDYQGPTRVHAGSAIRARNMAYNRRRSRQRDGLVNTAFRQAISGSPVTGYDVLEVVGDTNPGLYLIAFTAAGKLYIESPSGSGAWTQLATPFALPANARMQTASAYNCLYMAFTDGAHGLCPPLRYNGLTQIVEPTSQNPVGARWLTGRFAEVGDLVQDANGFFWRCTQAGFMGTEPVWPGQIGYFDDTQAPPHYVAATAESADGGHGQGDTKWEEWTPAFANLLPSPVITGATTSAQAGAGTIPAAKDIYIRLAYNSDETGEGPWSDPIIFVNTPLNAKVTVKFRTTGIATTGGPSMPRWLAQLNLRSDAFFPFALNVYAAMVNTGAGAPTTYYQQQSDASPGEVVSIAVDPSTGVIVSQGRPTTATSPDPGFGGTTAFATPGQAIDSSSNTAAVGKGSSTEVKVRDPEGGYDYQDSNTSESIIISGFAAPPGSPVGTIFLYTDYAIAGANTHPGNQVQGTISYTLDNGVTWVVISQVTNSSVARNVFKLALPGGQDYTKIKVRAEVVGGAPGETGITVMTLSIYDTRIGVNATIGQILLRETASGIGLFGPPTFTGETGLRYAVLIHVDDTDSLSPVDPAAPIPVLFTSGEAQRVAILPPGGPSTSQVVVALTVVNSSAAGPFFDITANNPTNPVSSQITSITRDGSGNVFATVKNALAFEAGLPILANGIGHGLDGSFLLANVNTTTNQLQWAQDGAGEGPFLNAGTVTEVEADLITGADSADSFFLVNFDDDFLSKSRDDTQLLTYIPAPQSSDVCFLEALQKMCYVDDSGQFFFSQTQDPGNINSDGGVLGIETSAGGRGVGVREMTHGQIIAIKTNGGYQLDTSDPTPGNWNPERLWGSREEQLGPPCAQMMAVGKEFIAFGCKEGAFIWTSSLEEITAEIRSDDSESGSWNAADWKSELNFWCAIDQEAKEVHFGVDTGVPKSEWGVRFYEPGYPSEVLRVCYRGGWDFPEARTRTGALITPDTARKWSRDPIAARCAKYIKRNLVAPVACAGDPYAITAYSWNAGVAQVVFGGINGGPPADVNDSIQIPTLGGGNATLTEVVVAVGFAPFTLSFAAVVNPWAGGAVPQTGALLTTVEDKSAVKAISTRQMTYALSAPPTLKQYPVVSLTRAGGVVTAIVTAQYFTGSTASVFIDQSQPNSFNGYFAPTLVQNNNDGTWSLQWNQQDVDETSQQGTLATTVGAVRLAAFEPGRLDDNGVGIDCQYQPSYAQDGKGSVLRFGGVRGMALGTGKMYVHFETENPEIEMLDEDIDLKDNRAVTQFTRAASNGDPLDSQYGAPRFSNGNEVGNGFELIEVTVYANPQRPSEDA